MPAKKLGRPTLSPDEAARALDVLRRALQEHFRGNQTQFAKRLGIAQPSLNRLLAGTANPSRPTLKALAKILGVANYEDLISGSPIPEVTDPRFPSKDQAARAAQMLSLSEAAIAMMFRESPGVAEDPGALYWFHRVESFTLEVGSGSGSKRR